MENNNGRGIFYGVIGVATLVVAIIGATFAYFSASITSSNNAVEAGSASLSLEFTPGPMNFRSDMIPVETVDNNGAFYTYPGVDSTDCVDDVGNSICSVFEFTITNPETSAQTVTGSMEVTSNQIGTDTAARFQNLYYAVFKGAAANIDEYNVNAAAVSTNTAVNGDVVVARTAIGETGTVDKWEFTQEQLEAVGSGTNSTTYTVVVWLEEAGEANNAEQGGVFTASITFGTGIGTGVTGQLTART